MTPFWFGFHDGSFDLFESGEKASPGLEQLAEDGASQGLGSELRLADSDGQGFVIGAPRGNQLNTPILAGETTDRILTIDGVSNGTVSLGAMILPSNDAFIGTDEDITLFGSNGGFLGERTLVFQGSDVFDAGTELNTERDAAFINQRAPNTGEDENGVVGKHPGFNGSFGNPVGEGDQIILGGINAFGQPIDPIAADFSLPGSSVAVVHINMVKHRTGTDRRDIIVRGKEDDLIDAGAGNDFILGGRGWDVINGGDGNDRIGGGAGDDIIHGGAGNDDINGGRGQDLISGGTGNDKLRGGADSDSFFFRSGDGHNEIIDFSADDRLVLELEDVRSFESLLSTAVETRRGLVFDFGSEGSLWLGRAELGFFTAEQVSFV